VGLPDVSARLQTLRIHTRDLKIARDVDLERIARDTKRFSGADLEGLVVRATLRAADRKDAVEVTRADFETELARAAPSVSVADERLYERLRDEFDPDPSRPKRTSRIGF
jgi:transitional endoplasmic reticulum ATPase